MTVATLSGGSQMNGEIGYIVSVRSMREYVLRRDEVGGPAPGDAGGPSAPPEVGALAKVGRDARPVVAVISGVARALHEELQPYIPSEYQSKYLPSQEDFRDSYLTLHGLGELAMEGEDVAKGMKEGGNSLTGEFYRITRVPELSDPVSLLTPEETVRFHTRGGQLSLGYLQELSRSVEPEALLRLIDMVRSAAELTGTPMDDSMHTKFKAVRRHIARGVYR